MKKRGKINENICLRLHEHPGKSCPPMATADDDITRQGFPIMKEQMSDKVGREE